MWRSRRTIVVSMIAVTLAMVSLIAFRFAPDCYKGFRERTLQSALETRSGPGRWWPTSWWRDYDQHVELARQLAERETAQSQKATSVKWYEQNARKVEGPARAEYEKMRDREAQKYEDLAREVESLRAELSHW